MDGMSPLGIYPVKFGAFKVGGSGCEMFLIQAIS